MEIDIKLASERKGKTSLGGVQRFDIYELYSLVVLSSKY